MRAGESWEELRPHLAEVGIALEVAERLDAFDATFAALAEHVGGEGPPALVAQPGQLKNNLLGMTFLNRLESWEVRGDTMRLHGNP